MFIQTKSTFNVSNTIYPPQFFLKTLFIVTTILLFNGCAKKDISAPLLIAAKNQQEVIEQFLKIPENASDELKYLVNDIQKTEKEYHFLYAYVQRNGIPNWGAAESNIPIFKGVVTKTGNITSNSVANNSSNNSASAETYFIPLIDTVSKEVKSYIFCRKNIDGKINYKTYNKQAILSSTAKDSSDVKIKGVLLSVFAHFERKINNKNTLLLPFPYNYNFENMEIKFLSSQIGDANSISKNATSDGLIKKNDNVGCDFIIKITGTGNFLLAYGAVLTLHFNCNGIIFSWEVEGVA